MLSTFQLQSQVGRHWPACKRQHGYLSLSDDRQPTYYTQLFKVLHRKKPSVTDRAGFLFRARRPFFLSPNGSIWWMYPTDIYHHLCFDSRIPRDLDQPHPCGFLHPPAAERNLCGKVAKALTVWTPSCQTTNTIKALSNLAKSPFWIQHWTPMRRLSSLLRLSDYPCLTVLVYKN